MRTEWFAPCAACAHRASIHSLFLPSALSLSLQGIPAWSNSVSQVNQAPRANYRAAPRTSINAQFRGTSLAQTIPAIMPDGTIGRIAAPAASSSVPRVVGINGPMSAAQVQHQLTSEVLGRSRVKFFKRPVIPFLSADGAAPTAEQQAAIDAAYAANLADQQAAADAAVEEAHRTFGTQTDYRESETQTDPYTPDYITSPEEPEPEILGLAHLTYGAGLPASMAELNLIQRMREKKAFEASLPPITDAASFELRKQMLEERELAEWALREEEMKQEQEDRLQILVDTLKLREAKVEELNEQRIDAIRQARVRVRDEAFDAIHRDRIKMHRALGKNRVELDASTAHMSGGYKELTSSHTSNRRNGLRDIVGDYADHSSQVYAPVQRQGKLPVKNQVVDYGIPLISNFQGLSDLERHLPSSATSLTVTQPQIRVASLATRKGQAIRADLDYVDSLLEAQRADGLPVGITGDAKAHYGRKKGLIENVYKKFEPVQRAPTPTVQIPDEEEASRAVLLLQRLLRGRMVQNAMYEGKQHHRALIAELRVAENPPEEVETDEDEVRQDTHTRTQRGENNTCPVSAWVDSGLSDLSQPSFSFPFPSTSSPCPSVSPAAAPRSRHSPGRAGVDSSRLCVEGGGSYGRGEPHRRSRAPCGADSSSPRVRGERSSSGGGGAASEARATDARGDARELEDRRSIPRRAHRSQHPRLRRVGVVSPRCGERAVGRADHRVDRGLVYGGGGGCLRREREHSRRSGRLLHPARGGAAPQRAKGGAAGQTIRAAGARGRLPGNRRHAERKGTVGCTTTTASHAQHLCAFLAARSAARRRRIAAAFPLARSLAIVLSQPASLHEIQERVVAIAHPLSSPASGECK